MSYALDVNILLYAANADSGDNERAVQFLNECADRGEVTCLAWPTLIGFLRMSTHPAIFPNPLSWQEATGYVDLLLQLPHIRTLPELDGFWKVYREVSGHVRAGGNLVPDAHLAAILKQHGVLTLYTNDSDFHKFRFLDVRNPLGSDVGAS